MRRSILLILGFILTACTSPLSINAPSNIINNPVRLLPSPSLTFLPVSPTYFPTFTELPTGTPTDSPTETATETATMTPIALVHIFPIQPPQDSGFAEGTPSHGYPATDIFAVIGTKFVAVTDGVVDFVSFEDLWDPEHDDPALRGGLSVAIIGDDGLRYYGSHLSAIGPGIEPDVRVVAEQVLGLVGNSGDARTTLSHLHLGISRPTYPDDWKVRRGQVDPFPFLQAWRDGHNVTPPLPAETDTPTATPNLFTYVFPVQPQEKAGFSPGGHSFQATDIFAPLGTKFVAVTSGTIDEVSYVDQWDPASNDSSTAGGLSVRFIGDDGLRYYGAHLSAIANGIHSGVWVAAGQLLGLVGNTGDARFTNPHLHFEISSPNPPLSKLDPYPSLVAWHDGLNFTPPMPTP
jgi:peptidoglycan LD-endopeptidase LytH